MKAEELINTLSNVNSEAALQAVEMYVEFLYFATLTKFATGVLCMAFVAWVVYLMVKHDQEQRYNKSMIREKDTTSEIVIDLTGPEGNAYVLLGYAKRYANDLGYSEEEVEDLMKAMQSGDYENLIQVFDDHFGHYVILERQ